MLTHSTARSGRHAAGFACGALLWVCALWPAGPVRAQDTPAHHAPDNIFDAYARWVVTKGAWGGATTPFPATFARPPDEGHVARSWSEALTVHAPRELTEERVHRTLEAAERGVAWLREQGWPLPPPDGGRGGTPGFDLYLQPGTAAPDGYIDARVDVQSGVGAYDDAITHAVIDPAAPRLEACVLAAVLEASLLALDPAEALSWRRATASYVAWLATGEFGCDGDGDADAQRLGADGLLLREPASATSGALWLAILADREDGSSGRFLRELWQFARQRTRKMGPLRASPNLWEVLERSLENADERFDDLAVDFAIARYFAGPPGRSARAPYPVLRSLPPEAAVQLEASVAAGDRARHVTLQHNLAPLGSSYVRVHVGGDLKPGDQLKVWLRAEQGPRWALSAVRLAANGAEVGRLHAPVRTTPKSFLPLELTAETHSVLLVVTHLPVKLELLTREDQLAYGAKLIIDLERAR